MDAPKTPREEGKLHNPGVVFARWFTCVPPFLLSLGFLGLSLAVSKPAARFRECGAVGQQASAACLSAEIANLMGNKGKARGYKIDQSNLAR